MRTAFALLVTFLTALWLNRGPSRDWEPHSGHLHFPACPDTATEVLFLFGGTSMLGRHIVRHWKSNRPNVCLVNVNRRKCESCDLSFLLDLRDVDSVERVFEHYTRSSKAALLFSVTPEYKSSIFKTFVEVNYLAIIDIASLAKRKFPNIQDVLYVGSIAASDHYVASHQLKESDPQSLPLLTSYKAPYDLTKRLCEDFLLSIHDASSFRVVSLRVAAIIGGEGDQLFHHRLPVIAAISDLPVIDSNYAKNIANALDHVLKETRKDARNRSGKFFYFTGENASNVQMSQKVGEVTGKSVVEVPMWMFDGLIAVYQWARFNHDYYTVLDMMRMAGFEQTFDNSLFHSTFPDFVAEYSVMEALTEIYGAQDDNVVKKDDL